MQEQFTPNAPVRILKKNPNYWDAGKPKAECLKITVAQEAVAAVGAIKSGQVDLVLNVDPSVIGALKDDPNVQLLQTAASNSMTVSMWVDTKPFDNPKVREAMKAGVDRQAMVDTVLLGFGETGADNPVPLGQSGFLHHGGAEAGYRQGQEAAGRGRLSRRDEVRPLHRRRRRPAWCAWRRSSPRWRRRPASTSTSS